MSHSSKPAPTTSPAAQSRCPTCKHNDEYSSAIANRSSARTDVIDGRNGGPTDTGEGAGTGVAPGDSGSPYTPKDTV